METLTRTAWQLLETLRERLERVLDERRVFWIHPAPLAVRGLVMQEF
ncbi:hypothetical protein H6H01_16720 [Nostoc calcicola FACHB-3891]|nr:hypothetical protein [Nostoc calcicola FACHB-3891]